MHEASLVRSLLSQAICLSSPSRPSSIRYVRIALGPLSGVEPVLVRQAFDQLKNPLDMDSCQLTIVEEPLVAECRECKETFEVVDFTFRCPACQSNCVRVTQGDEFELLNIEVEETTHAS